MFVNRLRQPRSIALLLAGLTALLVAPAFAQNPAAPQFEFGKPPEKPAEWKVQAKGGLLVTSGNSRSQTGTLSLDGSRQSGSNKLALNAAIAYGRSSSLQPIIQGGSVTGFDRPSQTTTNQWKALGRYDRFLTANNAAYGLAQVGSDRLAGKRLYGGAQAGYSRQLYKSEQHTTVAELGYDFSYETYVQHAGPSIPGVAIHSARLFAGELFSLTKETGASASVEALFNLNKENALDASDTTGATKNVSAFKDTRVIGKLGLTTVLRKSLSFGFGFTVKYDQNPAPRPLPASAGAATYAPGFQPFADKVDTLTEATLIFSFL